MPKPFISDVLTLDQIRQANVDHANIAFQVFRNFSANSEAWKAAEVLLLRLLNSSTLFEFQQNAVDIPDPIRNSIGLLRTAENRLITHKRSRNRDGTSKRNVVRRANLRVNIHGLNPPAKGSGKSVAKADTSATGAFSTKRRRTAKA